MNDVTKDLLEALKTLIQHAEKQGRSGKVYDKARAAIARAEAAPRVARLNVDDLSNFIRAINGNNRMGAGQLAENIAEYLDRNGIEVAQ